MQIGSLKVRLLCGPVSAAVPVTAPSVCTHCPFLAACVLPHCPGADRSGLKSGEVLGKWSWSKPGGDLGTDHPKVDCKKGTRIYVVFLRSSLSLKWHV